MPQPDLTVEEVTSKKGRLEKLKVTRGGKIRFYPALRQGDTTFVFPEGKNRKAEPLLQLGKGEDLLAGLRKVVPSNTSELLPKLEGQNPRLEAKANNILRAGGGGSQDYYNDLIALMTGESSSVSGEPNKTIVTDLDIAAEDARNQRLRRAGANMEMKLPESEEALETLLKNRFGDKLTPETLEKAKEDYRGLKAKGVSGVIARSPRSIASGLTIKTDTSPPRFRTADGCRWRKNPFAGTQFQGAPRAPL